MPTFLEEFGEGKCALRLGKLAKTWDTGILACVDQQSGFLDLWATEVFC